MQIKKTKTGGRLKGVPNKRTLELSQKISKLGLDPIEGLSRLLAEEGLSNDLRVKIYTELLPYLYPKRKAFDSDAGQKQAVVFNIGITPRVPADQADGRLIVEQ